MPTFNGTSAARVTVSEHDVLSEAIRILRTKTGLSLDHFIKDGKLMEEVEYATSHKWCVKKLVRDATAEDVENMAMLLKLEEFARAARK